MSAAESEFEFVRALDNYRKALTRTDMDHAPNTQQLMITCYRLQIIEQFKVALEQRESESKRLREVLNRYISAYPAFRMKPVGAEGSPARIEQENLTALEDAAVSAIRNSRGSL